MPDIRQQDAALAAATTVWQRGDVFVLPLTVALPAIYGARLCSEGRRPRLSRLEQVFNQGL